MVALAVNPAGQPHLLAHMLLAEFATGVGAVSVHEEFLFGSDMKRAEGRNAAARTAEKHTVRGALSREGMERMPPRTEQKKTAPEKSSPVP
ncbi:hypothetical protein GCM10027256_12120 [Novispirillum itersonii subsp. nipponicum]